MGSRLSSGGSGGGSGTVTSVGLSTSGVLHTVSGTPVVGAGTLSLDLKTQIQNTLLAGPASGADATPTMRVLVAADIPSLDAGKITTGTLALARLSGITGSQLDSAAAIASGQITSLAAGKLTGTNTLPDGVLSTNVPLLASANTFSAAQTVSATVAGVLAQINNASTTGAGLVLGSTSVASAGAGKIAPALAATQAIPATANYGLISVGSGPWDGSTTGKFAGHSSGTGVAVNAASGYGGNLVEAQIAGVSKMKLDSTGQLTVSSCLGNLYPNPFIQDSASSGPYFQLSTSTITANTRSAAKVGLTVLGAASQTADLQQWQDSAAHVQFAVGNRGSAGSPIWALKVRAVANAESAAQAHSLGAYSGKAIEVMDDAGASLGFLPIYG